MNRLDNLVDINSRPPQEQQDIRSKGGKAAAQSKRRRKELRERLQAALDMKAIGNAKDKLEEHGIHDGTYDDALCMAIVQDAVYGGASDRKLLFDLLGETPSEKRSERKLELEIDTKDKTAKYKYAPIVIHDDISY